MKFLHRLYLFLINVYLWAFFVVTSTVCMVVAATIWLLTLPFDPNKRVLQQFSCFWASIELWFNPFWKLAKSGLQHAEPGKTYVIVANHQSMADILCVFNTFLHFKWVAKKVLFNLPLLGWNMRLNGYIPIDRGNAETRDQFVEKCHRWLKKGSSVFFFPEGSRSHDGELRPFKPGAFYLAIDSGCDILPIAIDGSLEAIPKHSRLLSGKSKMRLEVLPAIPVAPYLGIDRKLGAQQLSDTVRAALAKAIGQ